MTRRLLMFAAHALLTWGVFWLGLRYGPDFLLILAGIFALGIVALLPAVYRRRSRQRP